MAGRITGIVVQRRNPNRINIYLDGDFAFGLHRLNGAWLAIGQELTDEQILELKSRDDREVVYQSALRLLGYKQRTAAEMRSRLLTKGYDPAVVQEVMEKLISSNLLDDRKYAEAWVNDRLAFHPRSKRYLAYEMLRKGLDRQVVDGVIASVGDDFPAALAAAQKASRRWSGLPEKEFVTRCAAYLGRKGFSAGTCYKAAGQTWHELHPEPED